VQIVLKLTGVINYCCFVCNLQRKSITKICGGLECSPLLNRNTPFDSI